MFRYRFVCKNRDEIMYRINQIMVNDLPCGKSIFGGDLYKSGVHFSECSERIKGFYLSESENENERGGSPIRVCFSGEFIEDAEQLYVSVCVYPHMTDFLFIMSAVVLLSVTGGIMGCIIAAVVLLLFTKGFVDMMKATYRTLERMFS